MKRMLLFTGLLVFAALPVAAQSALEAQWPTYGGDAGGQRYVKSTQITPSNVATLKMAWSFHTHTYDKGTHAENVRASFEATPIYWKHTLYFDTSFNELIAVDAATGVKRWDFDPQVNRAAPIYIITSRGIALWHASKPQHGLCNSDVVLMATLDRRLFARDATTGKPCPSFGDQGVVDLTHGVQIANKDLYAFTSPPTVIGDTIVLGSSIGDNQDIFVASGAIRGFDVHTGIQKWSWEPLRWVQGQQHRTTGSGNAWSVISADPEHDLVFVPTGSPSVDYYGGNRLGDNRDADSIVALRGSTGERVWAFQLVHHDLWDYDTPSEPLLFMFRHTIPAVAVVTKTSMVYVFNRLDGTPLYPVVERAVPRSNLRGEVASPTQPFSSLPPLAPLTINASDIHLKNAADQRYCAQLFAGLDNRGLFTPPSQQGSVVYPGALGGANWGSAAFDPETSTLFTRVSSLPFIVKQVKRNDAQPYTFAHGWLNRLIASYRSRVSEDKGGYVRPLQSTMKTPDSGGEQRDESSQTGTPFVLQRQALMTPDETPCAPSPFGAIVALNLDTGEKRWSVPHGEMIPGEAGSIGAGGVIATASGLLFAASTNDGYIRAYASSSGNELWKAPLGLAANATPMSFTEKGRQYLVIAAGGHGFIGKGQGDQVIAFALPKRP